ncbi:hypothetical protein [Aureispira sp. CCB-QB1]|uniref:hypothetical protein n=1 Tax=Aureispira sp. CCB-QB1 TaxID=1313421 RepID=UPI000696F0B0|nr:hypothetical protein [Aureispira sp. CCB-QB1]
MKNIYQDYESCVYEGLIDSEISQTDWLLITRILFKITQLKMSVIIAIPNKENNGRGLRNYEFKLFGEDTCKDGLGLFHLYIKGEENFIEHQSCFRYLHENLTQAIPLTFSVLSKLTTRELMVIINDLD